MREWLKELRQEKRFSQQDVAERLKITQQYYALIENGKRQSNLDLVMISRLAEAFEVSIGYIIEQEQKMQSVSYCVAQGE